MVECRVVPFRKVYESAKRNAYVLGLMAIVGLALSVRLLLLSGHRFHPDEALYATWAREIATGADPWLANRLVDKPPVLYYLIAIPFGTLGASEEAARLPNLIAGTLTVAVVTLIGSDLFADRRAGLLAGLYAAVSPMAALFSTTAFADPLMVFFFVASMFAARGARPGAAGLLLGLALATKPDAILFAPLVAWQALSGGGGQRRSRLINFLVGVAVPVVAVVLWSVVRQAPNYLQVSIRNFGGFRLEAPGNYVSKLLAWSAISDALGGGTMMFVVIAAITLGLWRDRTMMLMACLAAGWVILHVVATFPAWDRYGLPLVPLGALLCARSALWWVEKASGPSTRFGVAGTTLVMLILPAAMILAGNKPAVARDTRAAGMDLVGDYFWKADTTATILYYHGLGWQIEYYTYGRVLDRRWFQSEDTLADDAAKMWHAKRYVVVGKWEELDVSMHEALDAAKLRIEEVPLSHAGSGTPAITLYRIRDAAE